MDTWDDAFPVLIALIEDANGNTVDVYSLANPLCLPSRKNYVGNVQNHSSARNTWWVPVVMPGKALHMGRKLGKCHSKKEAIARLIHSVFNTEDWVNVEDERKRMGI